MTKENKETLVQDNDWKISGRILCIADIHQNVKWAKNIIESEKGNYDHIVFLGDFFDSFWNYPVVATVTDTAKFVIEIIEGVYGPATLLLGNHDLTYLEVWRTTSQYKNPRFILNYCSGYTNSKAHDINKVMTWEHWKKFKLFALCNGWLLTHAGVRSNNFRPFMEPERSLVVLEQEFNQAINHVTAFSHHLFAVGFDSGGRAAFGGPLWLRPQHFEDNEIPYPQMFGHTHTGKNTSKQYGRSFCIDGGQTTYAIIKQNGDVEIKSMEDGIAKDGIIQKWRTSQQQVDYVMENKKRIKNREKFILDDGFYPKITQDEWDKEIERDEQFNNFCKTKEGQWLPIEDNDELSEEF